MCIHKSRGCVPDTAAVSSALLGMSEGAEMDVEAFPSHSRTYKENPKFDPTVLVL